jgi:hypothetical protein
LFLKKRDNERPSFPFSRPLNANFSHIVESTLGAVIGIGMYKLAA